MRKWVFAFAIVAAALSVPFGKTTVGAQAPDVYGWWWQLREPAVPVDPRPLSPVPIPSVTVPTPAGVPEDGLYVEGAATEPQAIGALTFAIAEGTTATKLVLKAAVPLTPTTEILLCPTNNSWQPAAGGRWASRPLWTCAANAPKGVVPADGATLTFTLGDLGKSQLIDVALVPAPTSAFRAIFNKPDKDALTVVGGGTPDVAETAGSGGAVLGTGDLPGTLSGAFDRVVRAGAVAIAELARRHRGHRSCAGRGLREQHRHGGPTRRRHRPGARHHGSSRDLRAPRCRGDVQSATEPTATRPAVAGELRQEPGGGMKASRRQVIAIAVAFAVLLPACQALRINWKTITRSDAPLSFRPDRRLSMQSPKPEELVKLPVTVDWRSKDWDISNGNQYAVYIDTSIPSPDDFARVRLCTRLGELPPAPGDFRGICSDQRDRVKFTKATSIKIDCFEPHFNRGKRRMNDHVVRVVLVDRDFRRIGEAAADVQFRVDAKDARKCRGFEAEEE